MRIKLIDIPPQGLDLEFNLSGVKPGALGPQVGKVLQNPWAGLRLERKDDIVHVSGEFKAKLALVCSRCAGHFISAPAGRIQLVFAPLDLSLDEERQLTWDEMEVNFICDQALDLGQVLMNELSLGLPMAPLCREECSGLCPGCGKPRDEGCGCAAQESDPRWAKLAGLKEEVP